MATAKTTAKKAAAKKATAKKAATKKTAVKKATAKKAVVKKAAAELVNNNPQSRSEALAAKKTAKENAQPVKKTVNPEGSWPFPTED